MAQKIQKIETKELTLHVYSSKPENFGVTSVLLESENELALIDAQFSNAEAHQLVELIRSTGKELKTIFISHSDPDFYFGLALIAENFPQAAILSTAHTAYLINATKDDKLAVWKPVLKADAPQQFIVPRAIGSDHFMLEKIRVEVKQDEKDPDHSFLWIPAIKAIMGGIYIAGNIHIWMADTQTEEERGVWIEAINKMEKMGARYVIPAHFNTQQTILTDDSALRFTKQYLIDFNQANRATSTSNELITKMKSLYPGLESITNLETGAKVIKKEIGWKTVHSFPAIGRKAVVQFNDMVFELNFKDNSTLSFIGLSDSVRGMTDTMPYTAIEVAPLVYMVYWSEPVTGCNVVHVEDYSGGIAYTNINWPDGTFTNIKGTIELKQMTDG